MWNYGYSLLSQRSVIIHIAFICCSSYCKGHYIISICFILVAPTLPPTTQAPSTTPSDDCDDDQANCHSGTGDDYEVTGANIALMRLQPTSLPFTPAAIASFCYRSLSLDSLPFSLLTQNNSCTILGFHYRYTKICDATLFSFLLSGGLDRS